LAARLTGRKLLVTAHNVAGDRTQHGQAVRRAGTIAERWLADVVFAVSGGVRQTYVEELGIPQHRVQLLENIPLAPFLLPERFDARAKREAMGLRDPIVCSASRLNEVRDHATLIRALPRLVEQVPTLDVVFLGEGDQEPKLRRLIRELGLEGNVHLLGTRLDAVEIMAASDVFVQPTFYEGMSIAVLDAMSLGCPVVGSDVEGLRGLIETGRTGCLVPPGDATAMESALATLLTKPDVRQSIGRAARSWIVRELPPDRWIGRQEALYEAYARDGDARGG
jgi:glycosyltransferase involved in cell wall biosynthesis